jgi:AraC family transcriptional regulator
VRLNFREIKEPGVLSRSIGHVLTPVQIAQKLYYYMTQCGHYYCTGKYKIRREYFPNILVIAVLHGSMHLEYRGQTYTLRSGNAAMIDCTEPHMYAAEKDLLEFEYIHFDGVNSHELCRYLLQENGPMISKVHFVPMKTMIEEMLEMQESQKSEPIVDTSMRIYRMLHLLHGELSQMEETSDYISRISSYINQNIDQKITLHDLASEAGLSEYHFSRRFKRDTGYSPVEFAAMIKTGYARELLIRTDLTVSEIADRVGYELHSFSNFFTQKTGNSPQAYRKMIHAGKQEK